MSVLTPFNEYAEMIKVGLIGLGIAGGCCLWAVLAASLRELVAAVFAIVYRPLDAVRQWCRTTLAALSGWMRAQIEDESERKGEGPLYYVIGALFYTTFTAVFLFCDIGVFCLIAAAMGLGEGELSLNLPADTGTMTAMALVAASLFWGAIFFDLVGVTRLAPWRKALSPAWRKVVIGVSIASFCLSLAIGGAMAYWRGSVVSFEMSEAYAAVGSVAVTKADEPQAAQNFGGIDLGTEDFLTQPETAATGLMPMPPLWLIPGCLVGLTVLSFTSTAFSMVGLSLMIKFFVLLVILAGSLPLLGVSGLSALLVMVVDAVFNLVRRAVDFIAELGALIMRPFGWRPAVPPQPEVAPGQGPQAGPTVPPASEPGDAGFNPFGPRKD